MQTIKNIDFSKSLNLMREDYGMKVREFPRFSFGNQNHCEEILKNAILTTDRTITDFKFLPEYKMIAEWMVDTKGKGMFLTGDVGRGKTNIVLYVAPLIFLHFHRKIVKTAHAEELGSKIKELKSKKFIAIDEMGVEPITNEYGTKFEAMNRIINMAEADSKILFISTNMNSSQVLERYGERTFDRINRLCKIIKFQGDSFRK